MKIYDHRQVFDRETGKPILEKFAKEFRCDYSGQVIDINNHQLYCSYLLDYGAADPCFGSDGEEYDLGEDYLIDMTEFMLIEYTFIQDYTSGFFPEQIMMKKWKGIPFHEMCRRARVRTAKRLLKDGTFLPEQLIWNVD